MVVDAAVFLRNQRKQTLSQYLSDTCRPSAIAGVKKDLQLILQTHLQGVQNADHKARWDEVYLIKKKREELLQRLLEITLKKKLLLIVSFLESGGQVHFFYIKMKLCLKIKLAHSSPPVTSSNLHQQMKLLSEFHKQLQRGLH